jgi:hypothetical protein
MLPQQQMFQPFPGQMQQGPIQLPPPNQPMAYMNQGALMPVQHGAISYPSSFHSSVTPSVLSMPSPSMAAQSANNQQLTDLVTGLGERVEQLTQRLQALGSDIPRHGHARMYAAKGVVSARINAAKCSIDEHILDGGTTHHVASSPQLLFNKTASHINSVLVAGGEGHEVTCEGEMALIAPHGTFTIVGVLCVPTFVVNLMSESQFDEQGGRSLRELPQSETFLARSW